MRSRSLTPGFRNCFMKDTKIIGPAFWIPRARTMVLPCFGGAEKEKADPLLISEATPSRKVLLEIVGAMGLAAVENCTSSFCVIAVNDKIVHKTSILHNDTSPIWTVKSNSLALLDLNHGDSVRIDLKSNNLLALQQTKTVFSVTITYDTLNAGEGKRVEYKSENLVTLALRYRPASGDDLDYFQVTSKQSIENRAADVDFKNVETKKLFQQQVKKRESLFDRRQGEKKFRVWPGPDPDNPRSTEFMTKQEIKETALLPSKVWSEVGNGNYGSLYIEILGCDDLPNMDLELIDGLTDAFAALVFEDCYVRSSVIHDSLSPRWMPWSNRAFKFNIAHPASILFLGVFDYDDQPIQSHDPISRIEIHPSDFENSTVYTLTYPYSTEKFSCSITVRLRVEWNDPKEVITALSFVTPPYFFINVKTQQSWNVVRYLTRGPIDLQEVSIPCLQSYVAEFIGHCKQYCYLLDNVAEILLWRGRINFKIFNSTFSVWFPIHSIFLFLSITLAIESPHLLPAILPYAIAYFLLWNNWKLSNHPNPWCRVKSFRRFTDVKTFESKTEPLFIEPGTGREEAEQLELLDEYKVQRSTAFFFEFLALGLRIYRVYNKSLPVDFSTVKSKESFLTTFYSDYLSYAISLFRVICKKMRLLRSFVNWKSPSTYKFTLSLLVFGTVWVLFPFKRIVFSSAKVIFWIIFGPHVKILDILWIQKYYRTKEQLLEDGLPTTIESMKEEIANRPNILDPLMNSSWIREMVSSGRVIAEDSIKLRDFREGKFGSFSEIIHCLPSPTPSIPTYSSFAQPYASGGDQADEGYYKDDVSKVWSYIQGQKLEGAMVPQPVIQPRVSRAKKNA